MKFFVVDPAILLILLIISTTCDGAAGCDDAESLAQTEHLFQLQVQVLEHVVLVAPEFVLEEQVEVQAELVVALAA